MFFKTTFTNDFLQRGGFRFKLYNLEHLTSLNNNSRLTVAFLTKLLQHNCANNIGIDYRKRLINNIYKEQTLLDDQKVYDMIIIATDEINSISSANINTEFDKIKGFMIVEKGECQTYSDNYCVNLICTVQPSNTQAKPTFSVGNILIALYIYVLIQDTTIVNKVGLLELANSYYNVGGLCLYTKYGFVYDRSLSTSTCFPVFPNTMPMIANILDYGSSIDEQTDRLFDIIAGKPRSFTKPSICNQRDKRQMLLALALNLEMGMKGDYFTSDNTTLKYDILNDAFTNGPVSLNDFIASNGNQMNDTDVADLLSRVLIPPAVIIHPLVTKKKITDLTPAHRTRSQRTRSPAESKKTPLAIINGSPSNSHVTKKRRI
jgi:hypothetical protein